jgi:S-adenosylmethionine decarboxylase
VIEPLAFQQNLGERERQESEPDDERNACAIDEKAGTTGTRHPESLRTELYVRDWKFAMFLGLWDTRNPFASITSVRGPRHSRTKGERMPAHSRPTVGREWIVDAHRCTPSLLASRETLEGVFARIIHDLHLKPVRQPLWHTFPNPGGVTGVVVLSESHLTCHTFPEYGIATFNLYSCRSDHAWPWEERLKQLLGAADVSVRTVERGVPVLQAAALGSLT